MEKIYKILTGNSEDEYYTHTAPKFKDDEFLICKDVVIRKFVEMIIVNKRIRIDYASETKPEQTFSLDDGVVIKSISVDFDWINRTELEAKEQLKERELEVYREVIPKLLSRQQFNIEERQQPGKNLFID